MAKRLDWEGRARAEKARKPPMRGMSRAMSWQINAAHSDYVTAEVAAGRKPLSLQKWRDEFFAVLMNRST